MKKPVVFATSDRISSRSGPSACEQVDVLTHRVLPATLRSGAPWWPQLWGSATVPGIRASRIWRGSGTRPVSVGEVVVAELAHFSVGGVHVEVVGRTVTYDEVF